MLVSPGGHTGTNKGKMDSRGQNEGLSLQAKITCNHCQKLGHIRHNFPERQCFKRRGWGHEAVSCPSKASSPKNNEEENNNEPAVMAVAQHSNFDKTAGTKVDEIGGGHTICSMTVEITKNTPPIEELPLETTVKRWVANNSGCSQLTAPFADYMVNYREGGGVIRIADDRAMLIEGIGSLPMSFWAGNDWVQVILPNVTHVPLLRYNLLSLKRMTDHDLRDVTKKKGVTLHLKNEKTGFGP